MRSMVSIVAFAAVTACGTPPPPRYSPGDPSVDQAALYKQALELYINQDPGFDAVRDEAAQDPVVSYRLTQALVVEWMKSLQSRGGSVEAHFLAAAAGKRDPYEDRARDHLKAMGPQAVMPFVREELLKPPRGGEGRYIGLCLVEELGAPALPFLDEMVTSSVDRHRRIAVQAVGAAGDPQASASILEKTLQDPDFSVRAMTVQVLGRQEGTDATLRRLLVEDQDSFVRRMAAEQLGGKPSRENAELLVDYLEQSIGARDHQAVEAAQEALQELAGSRGVRSVEAWRAWLDRYVG